MNKYIYPEVPLKHTHSALMAPPTTTRHLRNTPTHPHPEQQQLSLRSMHRKGARCIKHLRINLHYLERKILREKLKDVIHADSGHLGPAPRPLLLPFGAVLELIKRSHS